MTTRSPRPGGNADSPAPGVTPKGRELANRAAPFLGGLTRTRRAGVGTLAQHPGVGVYVLFSAPGRVCPVLPLFPVTAASVGTGVVSESFAGLACGLLGVSGADSVVIVEPSCVRRMVGDHPFPPPRGEC